MVNKYNNNYLTNVIVRIDFSDELQIHDKLPSDLTKSILKFFPIPEPKKLVGRTIKISPEKKVEMEGDDLVKTEWNYYGQNRNKRLVLDPSFLSITYKKYESFEQLKSEFIEIIAKLYDVFGEDINTSRLGLRYINEISLDETNPLDWDKYLNKNLLSAFSFPKDKSSISRIFNKIILNYGDEILHFNYGMHNPDYPAPIKKKLFVLDYDAYHEGYQEFDELEYYLKSCHEIIENIFEESITDALRGVMNDGRL